MLWLKRKIRVIAIALDAKTSEWVIEPELWAEIDSDTPDYNAIQKKLCKRNMKFPHDPVLSRAQAILHRKRHVRQKRNV